MENQKEEIKTFLDELRASGSTNMVGAAPHLQAEFGMTRAEAKDALFAWMRSFTQPAESRSL